MARAGRKGKEDKTGVVASAPAPPAGLRLPRWQDVLILAVVLLAVLIAYQPVWNGGKLWDDAAHITAPELRSWSGLWRIWFEVGATQQYYPVTHSAFWMEARLWGDRVLGYHLVNIALHAISSFFIIIILRRLTVPGALLAGVLFALHPVQVESVAWMAELKNTLSGVFYFAGLLAYLSFDQSRRSRPYLLAALFFVLALLSKSVTATLPVALLVVFWWQRGTLSWRRDARPLIPFFALAIAAGLTTAWVERTLIGARGAEFDLSAIERLLIAGRAFLFYLRQLLWPADLVFIYPRWKIDAAVWWQYLYPASAAALLVLAWKFRDRTRAPLASLLYFGVTLAPALGFVNVYPFRFSFVADHFQYLAASGVIALIAAVIDRLLNRVRTVSLATVRATAVLALGLMLGVLSWHQSRLYAHPRILNEDTLRRNPSAWLAHLNLGYLADQDPSQGKAAAVAHYQAALAINPNEPQVHKNLGTVWMEMGRLEDALKEFEAAVRLAPGYADAYLNLGVVLQRLGRYREAEAAYRYALEIKPGLAIGHYDLGVLLTYLGRRDEALSRVNEALRIQPHYADASRLLRDLVTAGPNDRPAVQIAGAPDANAHARAGEERMRAGQFEEAVAEFTVALQLELGPSRADVLNNLGVALARLDRMDEAVSRFREAVRLNPSLTEARANLEKALLTKR